MLRVFSSITKMRCYKVLKKIRLRKIFPERAWPWKKEWISISGSKNNIKILFFYNNFGKWRLLNVFKVKSDGYHNMLLELSHLKTFLNELRLKFKKKTIILKLKYLTYHSIKRPKFIMKMSSSTKRWKKKFAPS